MRSLLILFALGSFGCAAYTPKEQDDILSRLEVGITTKSDIEKKPSGIYRRDGYEYWLFPFESSEPGHGGADTRTRMVELKFDEQGILRGFTNRPVDGK